MSAPTAPCAWDEQRRAAALIEQRDRLLRRMPRSIRDAARLTEDLRELIVDESIQFAALDYLGQLDGAIAASHLRLGPDRYERLSAHVLPHAPHVAEHARACLLDHAAELQQAIADLTDQHVLVDVAASTLERAGQAWGPPATDA